MKLCHTSIRIQQEARRGGASKGEKANAGKVGSKARSEGKIWESRSSRLDFPTFFCIRDAAVESPFLKRESRLYTTLPGRKKTLENVFSRLFGNAHVVCIFDIHPLLTV